MVRKIVATIEARMTSSRLPGKVLFPVNGMPLLGLLVERLRKVPLIDQIVLATTINQTDDILENFAQDFAIACYRGSEENVMQRVIQAAESVGGEIIVETTGDNPLIDPLIIEQVLLLYLHNECDYASNVEIRSYPIGMDTQVFSLETLKRSYQMTVDPLDREHVTRHIRQNSHLFKKLHLVANSQLTWPDLALTLDEPADYQLIKNIVEYFDIHKKEFSCLDIIELLRDIRPQWKSINEEIRRRGLNH